MSSNVTPLRRSKPTRTLRVDYKTLVAAIGVIVALAALLAVLNSVDARREAARELAVKDSQIASRDKSLGDAQKAAAEAAEEARTNGKQIDELIAQLKVQNAQVSEQTRVVSALRNELAKRGISTVVEDGKVKIVPGPVRTSSTPSGGTVRGASSGPGKATGTVRPTGSRTTPSTTARPPKGTPTTPPAPLPSPSTILPSIPILGDILGVGQPCTALICL